MKTEAFNSERIDTLLALAFVFGDAAEESAPGEANSSEATADDATPAAPVPLSIFETLSALDRASIDERAARCAALSADERARWTARALNRGREKHTPLDEHVHPSHVVAWLDREPPRVQLMVLQHLPTALAAAASETLGVRLAPAEHGDAAGDRQPPPEIVEVVRRTFVGDFVTRREIFDPGSLDSLSGVELRRLIRLLGVRETAIACRGIAAVETVASFLRRFEAADARAIVSHIASLTDLDAERVRLAEKIVRHVLDLEDDPGAMLYRTGLRVLATDADWRDGRRLRYTAQKLPVEAAEEFARAAHEALARGFDCAADARAAEIEALATKMREATAETPRAGADHIRAI